MDLSRLLLVPIAFGMLLVNIYPDIMAEPYTDAADIEHAGGLLHYFYITGRVVHPSVPDLHGCWCDD